MNYRRLVICIACYAVTSCAFPTRLETIAIDYNKTVAETTDALTLLNIVRAQNRRPMHFTSFSQFTGGMTVSATPTFGSSVGGVAVDTARDAAAMATGSTVKNGATNLSSGITGSISTSPSFDIKIHNDQDFYNGITTSVDTAIIHHFLRQGWREDLLAYLFIEEVRIYEAGNPQPIITIENDPDHADPDKFEDTDAFGAFVACTNLVAGELDAKPKTLIQFDYENRHDVEGSNYNGILTGKFDAAELTAITKLDGEEFDYLKSAGGKHHIGRPGKQRHVIAFRLEPSNGEGSPCEQRADQNKTNKWNLIEKKLTTEGAHLRTGSRTDFSESLLSNDDTIGQSFNCTTKREDKNTFIAKEEFEECRIEADIRSVLSVLYFLGEYIRSEHCSYYLKPDSDAPEALLVVHSETRTSKCENKEGREMRVIQTSLDGEDYWVPKGGGDRFSSSHRSMQVIALVQQLLNLQKSADTAPRTSTVRLVGGN